MYTLTLSLADRQAFDWVGDRNSAGNIACFIRMYGTQSCDSDWDSPHDITWDILEWVAWMILDAAQMDDPPKSFPCFDASLQEKMRTFCDSIV